jgi:hypothetical protein
LDSQTANQVICLCISVENGIWHIFTVLIVINGIDPRTLRYRYYNFLGYCVGVLSEEQLR